MYTTPLEAMPHNQLAPQAITRGLKRAAIDKRKGQEAAVAQQILREYNSMAYGGQQH